MKTVKERGLLIVALFGVVVIGWGCYVAARQSRKLARDSSLVRAAIDNADRITVVIGGKTRTLDAATNSDVLDSFHDAVEHPSVPPAIGVRQAAVLKVGREDLSYIRQTGQVGVDRDYGRREWFTLPQPARGKIESVVDGMGQGGGS